MMKRKRKAHKVSAPKARADANFGCQLFKFQNVADLLSQIDERIDIIEQVADEVTSIEGVNVLLLWRELYAEIKEMWLGDMQKPFITLNKRQELTLHFIADFVAIFFLHNGSEVDNDFLKNVSGLFQDTNEAKTPISIEDRFAEIKKLLG